MIGFPYDFLQKLQLSENNYHKHMTINCNWMINALSNSSIIKIRFYHVYNGMASQAKNGHWVGVYLTLQVGGLIEPPHRKIAPAAPFLIWLTPNFLTKKKYTKKFVFSMGKSWFSKGGSIFNPPPPLVGLSS